MSYFSNLFDAVTGRSTYIDPFRNLRVAQMKRVVGTGAGPITDSFLYTTTVAGTGAYSVTTGTGTLTTGATANSSVDIKSVQKARYMSGRANILRVTTGFLDTGVANNVREFGLFVDASNQFNFRLSGTVFSVVVKKAGVEIVVNSGSFNGASSTYAVDANIHSFEIVYTFTSILFVIDNVLVHRVSSTTATLLSSIVGQLYISNANSGGSTSVVNMNIVAWSIQQVGDSINNPMFYNINAIAETRTLKTGGGTLQSISVGRAATSGLLTIYDSTSGTGSIIAIFDIGSVSTIGTHMFGIEGVNFYTGLTYVTSGVMTNGSVTVFWE